MAAVESQGFSRFSRYREDPVLFIKEVLKEKVTPDVKRLCKSFVENPATIAQSANSTGKTHAAARLAIWFFLVWDDSKVFTAAAPPEDNLKRLLWGEIGSVVTKNPQLFDPKLFKVSLTGLHIERRSNPNSFLTGVTIPVSSNPKDVEARFSGKHAPHIAFFVDEGDAVPSPVYAGIESCLSGGHGRLLVMFNPRQEAGETLQMTKQGRANVVKLTAFNHPNVWSGKDIYPGAVDRETTARRINLWTRPLHPQEKKDKECFEVPSFLEGYVATRPDGTKFPPISLGVRKIINPKFSYMVLGEYPAMTENQLISREWVEAAKARWHMWVAKHGETPPRGVRPVAGQDVADMGLDLSTLCFRYGGWVPRIEWWQGQDPDITARKAAQACINANALFCNVDSTGVGASVPHSMRRNYKFPKANRVMVGSSAPDNDEADSDEAQCELIRDLMLWKLREWLRTDPSATLPPDELLEEELLALKYAPNPRGKIKVTSTEDLREILKRSPDRLMALALTHAPEPDPASEVTEDSYIG
jgi:hypothetical protein